MASMHKDPCAVFSELAHTTWTLLGQCHALKVRLDEDTITTLLLTNIATRLNSTVLYADSRAKEAEAGCDFELLIGSDSDGWYRFALQAKRISIPTGAYNKLDHKVGRLKVPQIELLRTYARNCNAFPLYVFYNHLINASALHAFTFGCSIAPLAVVERALATRGARNFDWIHSQSETAQWSSLVCPSGSPMHASVRSMFHTKIFRRANIEAEEILSADQPRFFSQEIPADIQAWRKQGRISANETPMPLALAIIDTQR